MSARTHNVATSVVINCPPARLPNFSGNQHAVDLHCLALRYLTDAEALGNRASPGQYLLAIHAVELTLKAFLHEKGLDVRTLASKQYGHNLESLLAKSIELGLSVSDAETSGIVKRLNDYSSRRNIRYEVGSEMPVVADVLAVVRSLQADAEPALT